MTVDRRASGANHHHRSVGEMFTHGHCLIVVSTDVYRLPRANSFAQAASVRPCLVLSGDGTGVVYIRRGAIQQNLRARRFSTPLAAYNT